MGTRGIFASELDPRSGTVLKFSGGSYRMAPMLHLGSSPPLVGFGNECSNRQCRRRAVLWTIWGNRGFRPQQSSSIGCPKVLHADAVWEIAVVPLSLLATSLFPANATKA